MKEEEALCGVGEISLGLRTDTSGCFLHSGSRSCERASVAHRHKAGEAEICTSQAQRVQTSPEARWVPSFFFFLQIRVHRDVCEMIAGSPVCVCALEHLSSSALKEGGLKKKKLWIMFNPLCVCFFQVATTFSVGKKILSFCGAKLRS